MPGSLRWFPYTTSIDGTSEVFGIQADESNTEAAQGAETELPDPPPKFGIPGNLRARQVILKNSEGNEIRAYVLTQARFDSINLGATNIISGYTVVRKNPEVFKRNIVNLDTGLTDGDTEGQAAQNP